MTAADRAFYRALAAARREMGLCPDCGEPRGDKSRCEKHLAIHAERARATRAKLRAAKGGSHGRAT